jgi:hypothetical protein
MKRVLVSGIVMGCLIVVLAGCGSTKVTSETYEKKVETTREIVIE